MSLSQHFAYTLQELSFLEELRQEYLIQPGHQLDPQVSLAVVQVQVQTDVIYSLEALLGILDKLGKILQEVYRLQVELTKDLRQHFAKGGVKRL